VLRHGALGRFHTFIAAALAAAGQHVSANGRTSVTARAGQWSVIGSRWPTRCHRGVRSDGLVDGR
jgi:hypothetical protein